MKQVQQALSGLDIPVYAGIWRPTVGQQNPPAQYAVYATTTTEDVHLDDTVVSLKTFVYLNLWSEPDPTEVILAVRAALRAAEFALIDERIQASPDEEANQYLVSWTWVFWSESDNEMEESP